MDEEARRSLRRKLGKVRRFTDQVNLSKEEAGEILRMYHPVFKNLKELNEFDKPDSAIHHFYSTLLSYLSDGSDPVYKTYATQVFLSIDLAAKFTKHKDSLFPVGLPPLTNKEKKRWAEFKKVKTYWSYNFNFDWYAEHTRREISEVILVDEKTIRVKCNVRPSRKREVEIRRSKADLYSAEESLGVLYWWLTEIFPRKAKFYPDDSFTTARLILSTMFDKQDLSEDAKQIIANKILPACGPGTLISELTLDYQYKQLGIGKYA